MLIKIKRSFFFIVFIVLTALLFTLVNNANAATKTQWNGFTYDANTTPERSGLWINEGGIPEVSEVNSGIYHMINSKLNVSGFYSLNSKSNSQTGFTMEWRAKYLGEQYDEGAQNGTIWIGGFINAPDGYKSTYVVFWKDAIAILSDGNLLQHINIDTSVFHVYRLTVKDSDVNFYVDNSLKLNSSLESTDTSNLKWGWSLEPRIGVPLEIYLDYFYYRNDGAFPPASAFPVILMGDANGDNIVDLSDYGVWFKFYDKNLRGARKGDFNGNRKVDGVDYVIWLLNYGK